MTFKNGFIVGIVAGIVAWAISARKVSLNPESSLPADVYLFAQIISLISIGVLIYGAFKGRSIFGTAIGGLIIGFLLGFELPTIWPYISHGELPPP